MVDIATLTGIGLIDIWLSAIITGVIAAITLAIAFVVGFYIAKAINTAIKKALEQAKVEKWIDDNGLGNALLGFRITQIVTVWLKVFIIVAALGFGFSAIEGYLGVSVPFVTERILAPFNNWLLALPQALVIVAGGLFIAKYVSNQVKKGNIAFGHHVASAIYIAVGYFVILLTVEIFLPVAGEKVAQLLTYLLIALVAGVGLAIGLAFGLGLKDVISKSATKNQAQIEKYFVNLGKK